MDVSFDAAGVPTYNNVAFNRFIAGALAAGQNPEHIVKDFEGIPYFGPTVRVNRVDIQRVADMIKVRVKWAECGSDVYYLYPTER